MKRFRIEIRVTSLEKKILTKKAFNCGLTLSEYIRQTALGNEPRYKLTPEEIEAYIALHKYERYFTNISNMYKNHITPINEDVRLVINLFKTHLSKFL
ncbi:MAG: mobilization protein [Salinivirgaceae bacterium]|jgi:hypothetical protein